MRGQCRYSNADERPRSIKYIAQSRDMLSCKRIKDSVSETVYFLLCTVHEDKRDLEHGSCFDVEMSDGLSAWAKKGLACQLQPTVTDFGYM